MAIIPLAQLSPLPTLSLSSKSWSQPSTKNRPFSLVWLLIHTLSLSLSLCDHAIHTPPNILSIGKVAALWSVARYAEKCEVCLALILLEETARASLRFTGSPEIQASRFLGPTRNN